MKNIKLFEVRFNCSNVKENKVLFFSTIERAKNKRDELVKKARRNKEFYNSKVRKLNLSIDI